MHEPVNLFDFEEKARTTLTRMAFDYYAAGAQDEVTVRANHGAFDRLELAYRVLAGIAERDLATTVLGERLALPILVAPTAFHKLAHPEGEAATARAAAAVGSVMVLSTLSNTPVEQVVAAAGESPVWFQLYIYRDRGATAALVQRVEAAGCRALMLTVDAPVLGRRERDVRNRFQLPDGLAIANLAADGYGDVPAAADGGSGLAHYVGTQHDPALAWSDLDWLRSICKLPLVVKGIVRPDDAVRAAERGAAAVVVSNHGGRQLDTAVPPISALPRVAEALAAAGATTELMMDGGVRRGTDVLKAIALGARAVLIGRPVLWGLAAGGSAGVERVFGMLREELDVAMALCGCRDIGEITRDLVVGP
jgi:4-hydroxymandelate oxidase